MKKKIKVKPLKFKSVERKRKRAERRVVLLNGRLQPNLWFFEFFLLYIYIFVDFRIVVDYLSKRILKGY